MGLDNVSLTNYEDIAYHMKKLMHDESYVRYIYGMVESSNRKDPEETWYVIQQMIHISELKGYSSVQAWGSALAGGFYLDRGNAMAAYDNFLKAYEIFISEDMTEGQAYCCNGIMMVYNHYGQFENALEWGLRGIDMAEEHDLGELIFSISVNMASIFIDYEMYDQAESLIERFFMSKLYYNPETVILRNNHKARIRLAMSFEDDALELIERTEAIAVRNKVEGLRHLILLTKADILSSLGENTDAEACYRESYEYALKHKNHEKDEILKKWGLHYLRLGRLEESEQKLMQAESLARNSEKRFMLSKILTHLTELYSLKGDFRKAYGFSKMSNQIMSDILNSQTSEAIYRASEKNTQAAEKSYKELYESINVLAETGKKITSELDMEKINWILYEEISKLMKVDSVAICTFDEDSGCLDYEMFIERGEKIPGIKVKIGDKISFAEHCITRNCDILIKNSHREYMKYIPENNISTESQFEILPKSLIFCPMIFAGKTTGVVTVQNYEENAFSYTDLSRIRLLAGYISIAVENSRLYREARHSSTHDQLTGVYNRREIHSIGHAISQGLRKTDDPVSVLMLDVDNFKSINDSYGHHTGDAVLKKIGELIKKVFEGSGYAGRYGGEEFMIIIPGKTHEEVVHLAEKARGIIQETAIEIKSFIVSATVSIGVDIEDARSFNLSKSIVRADNALYMAKQGGRNRVVVTQQ